jgi:hypothetical protein
MASNYIIAVLAEEHDKALMKSLLATFGDRGDNQWSYSEDLASADVAVVDFETHAQKLPLRGAKHGHIVVAYSQSAPSNPPTPFMLAKPVRGRDFVKLLERMEDVLTSHDEDEFAKTQRRIVF